MTPFARRIWLKLQAVKQSPKSKEPPEKWLDQKRRAMAQIEEAICFDVSDVHDLLQQTIAAMDSAVNYQNGEPFINHGGLAEMPHGTIWLEWQQKVDAEDLPKLRAVGVPVSPGGSYRLGCGLTYDPDVNVIGITILNSLDITDTMTAEIQLLPDDMCQISAPLQENHGEKTIAMCAGLIAQYVLAGLCIINAPYGIKKDAQPVHKAHAREARQRGFELKPHHVVTIHKTAPPKGMGGTPGHGAPKAFHFVRGHLRRLRNGVTTSVKAHFRGDPRLGILSMPDYKVKP